ncbi:hypothetical protein GCM10010191_53060 [Actinomadura vinacea]|uniref:VWFA domain-containing protein n=1 Tax=Actinomadura vinacea TaxID=115336 RepID=A0ABN3JKF2_9ACTN
MVVAGALWPVQPVSARSAPPAAPPAAAAPATAPETTPLDIVILADESASLSPQDVKEEIKATATIAQSGLNRRSRVTVLGFGSNNGGDGQRAVTELCRPTVVESAVRNDYLASCVRGLHRRTEAEGNDTDHVAALSQAIRTLEQGGPDGALKVVFVLTDGNLDVHRSPNYGRAEGDRNTEAQRQLKTQLGLASAGRIQIWPLGFGSQIDQGALNGLAAGGSQQACNDRPGSRPRARVVRGSGDVLRSLSEAHAAAACYGLSPTDTTELQPGGEGELIVAIPPIATDGKITVSKGDPRVRVDYYAPGGDRPVPSSGRTGDTEFSRSGENSVVETLGLVNPAAGKWKVKLTAPKELSRQLVSATAIWQGAVRSSIVVEPPAARTGQPLTVRLSLLTRRGAVTDPGTLASLNFAVVATGPALGGRQSDVVVRDDGKAPDDVARDGRYAGTLTAPGTAGDVTFTGVVSGEGIRAERVPVTVGVSADAPVLQGRIAFDSEAEVRPGAAVEGTLTMENAGGPVNARLVLEGPSQAATTLSAADLAVRQGRSDHPFQVRFGPQAALGGTSLTVKAVDPANLGKVYANGQLTVTIEPPPTWWERNRAFILAGLLVLALIAAALLWVRHVRRRRVDVRGLVAVLNRDGDPVGPKLRAPTGKWAAQFRFIIRDSDEGRPRLDYPKRGERAYLVRRGQPGRVDVRTPDGERQEVPIGAAGQPIETSGDGASGDAQWTLAFTDKRRPRPSSRPKPRPRPGSSRDPRADDPMTGGSARPHEPGPDDPEIEL